MVIPVGNEAPILHRSCREIRDGEHVLFGQRVWDVKVTFVESYYFTSVIQSVVCVIDCTFSCVNYGFKVMLEMLWWEKC